MPDRLVHPGYCAGFRFSDVPLCPGLDNSDVVAILQEPASPLRVL